MNIKILVVAAAFVIPTIASADDMKKAETADKSKATTKLEDADMKVVAHLNHLNMMEIDLGKMAQKQGTEKVKTFGAMIVKDHTAANKKLKALAKKKGVGQIPSDMPETEADKKAMDDTMAAMTRLKDMKGADFDREFLTMIAADHDREVAKIDTVLPTVQDPDLAAHLRELKPTLQRHADRARELAKAEPQASATPNPPKK